MAESCHSMPSCFVLTHVRKGLVASIAWKMSAYFRNDSWKDDMFLKEEMFKYVKHSLQREDILDFLTRGFAQYCSTRGAFILSTDASVTLAFCSSSRWMNRMLMSQVRNLFQCGTRWPLLTCENIAHNAFTNCGWEVLLTDKFNVR